MSHYCRRLSEYLWKSTSKAKPTPTLGSIDRSNHNPGTPQAPLLGKSTPAKRTPEETAEQVIFTGSNFHSSISSKKYLPAFQLGLLISGSILSIAASSTTLKNDKDAAAEVQYPFISAHVSFIISSIFRPQFFDKMAANAMPAIISAGAILYCGIEEFQAKGSIEMLAASIILSTSIVLRTIGDFISKHFIMDAKAKKFFALRLSTAISFITCMALQIHAVTSKDERTSKDLLSLASSTAFLVGSILTTFEVLKNFISTDEVKSPVLLDSPV